MSKEAIKQEPVAWAMYQRGVLSSFWMDKGDAYNFEFTSEHRWEPLYTSPPQRTWVGLTLQDREALRDQFEDWRYPAILVDAISNMLKEKNT